MFDTVECPYCEHENDMSDALCDGCPSDNKMDWECENCGREFEVYIEFEPVYSASKIKYTNCGVCGKRVRDFYNKDNVVSFSKSLDNKEVCQKCFFKAISDEYKNREQ